MERTAEFTAVPGWGGVAMGCTAIVAAVVAHQQTLLSGWLSVWAAEALIGFVIGGWATTHKARKHGVPLLSGQGRKFLLGLLPAVLCGTAVTLSVYSIDLGSIGTPLSMADGTASLRLLPGLWLMLYGAGVVAAGMFSIRLIPLLGTLFLLLGALTFLAPAAWGDVFLGVGFGGLNIVFGAYIAKRYGG